MQKYYFLPGHAALAGQHFFSGQAALGQGLGHTFISAQHLRFGHSALVGQAFFLGQHFFTHGALASGGGAAGSWAWMMPQAKATSIVARASFFMVIRFSIGLVDTECRFRGNLPCHFNARWCILQ
jgi:hypothetical protein